MTDDTNNDLENQVVHFVAADDNERPVGRLNRKRGRPAHGVEQADHMVHRTNNKVHRDREKTAKANKGHHDIQPWSQNAFCLPPEAQQRFEREGYVLRFCPLDDASLRTQENDGWQGVYLDEVPEWIVSSIPSVGQYHDLHRKFVVCIDQILMKIEVEQYERLRARFHNERLMNDSIITQAKQNSMNPYALNQNSVLNIKR